MPADQTALLAALQHGDSFFPGGAIAFSWGLETLRHDGLMRGAEDLERFVGAQLRLRWNTCDRAALSAAIASAGDLAAVGAIDRMLDALTLPREAREGSCRAGAALLGVHGRLGTPGAAAYRAIVRAGDVPGHLAVVQGLVWAGAGLSLDEAAAVAAHGFTVALLGAAVRLGICGHIDVQRILQAQRPLIAALLAEPAVPMAEAGSATFAADIAMMRHEAGPVRLFAN
jgi:urease accessory protein